MFGEKWLRVFGVIMLIGLLLIPFVLSLESAEVYDINDRQTKDLKSFISKQITDTKVEVGNMIDTLFQTFDKKMSNLTKSFAVQATVMMFFSILLANSISIMLRQKHEKKLMEFRYNSLLSKEIEIKHKEWDMTQRSTQTQPVKPQPEQPLPQQIVTPPEPKSEPIVKDKSQKRGLFSIFTKPKRPTEQQDIDKAMKGVM